MRNTSSQLSGPLFAAKFYNPKPLTSSQATSRFSRLMVRSLEAARRPITQITAGSAHQVPSALQIQRDNTSNYSHQPTPPPRPFPQTPRLMTRGMRRRPSPRPTADAPKSGERRCSPPRTTSWSRTGRGKKCCGSTACCARTRPSAPPYNPRATSWCKCKCLTPAKRNRFPALTAFFAATPVPDQF
jgi:hypothetical protein